MKVLKSFYRSVRPWGFWEPVLNEIRKEEPGFQPNPNFGRDMFNTAVGTVWQMSLIVMPIFLVLRDYQSMGISIAVILITSVILKYNWYDKLEEN